MILPQPGTFWAAVALGVVAVSKRYRNGRTIGEKSLRRVAAFHFFLPNLAFRFTRLAVSMDHMLSICVQRLIRLKKLSRTSWRQ
jgi:hypothetical protein